MKKLIVTYTMRNADNTESVETAIEQMKKTSLDFMIQVKNENDLFVKEVLSRTSKL